MITVAQIILAEIVMLFAFRKLIKVAGEVVKISALKVPALTSAKALFHALVDFMLVSLFGFWKTSKRALHQRMGYF